MAIKLKTNSGAIDLSAPVVKGIDGGYYIPNIDLDGNLSWTPVRDTMPTVPGANIKGVPGDPGKSGVYIGTSPGEDDMVWIDPTDGITNNMMTREEIEELIAQLDIGDIDLTSYAKKSELPTKVSELDNDAGYLTAHQDLSAYALKSEIPSTVGLATEDYVDNAVSNIDVDLTDYALKSEIPEANKDGSGNTIDKTYIKMIEFGDSTVTTHKGNGKFATVAIPYTTMSAVEGKGYQTAEQVKALITAELEVIENGTY